MSVVAKFYVQKVEKPEGTSTAAQIVLGAVCRGVENAGWASATPAGTITLWSLNDEATKQFVEGEEYLVHFTHAVKPSPGDGHQPSPVRMKWGGWCCEHCGASPSYDASKYDWKTVPAHELVWEQHLAIFGEPEQSL